MRDHRSGFVTVAHYKAFFIAHCRSPLQISEKKASNRLGLRYARKKKFWNLSEVSSCTQRRRPTRSRRRILSNLIILLGKAIFDKRGRVIFPVDCLLLGRLPYFLAERPKKWQKKINFCSFFKKELLSKIERRIINRRRRRRRSAL